MGWEKRGQTRRYYVRKRRVNGRVVSEYVGTGELAELAATLDQQARAEREAQREAERAKKEEFLQIDEAVKQFSDEVKQLVSQVLHAKGYHCHKGQWRKRRMTTAIQANARYVTPLFQQTTMTRMISKITSDKESADRMQSQINEMRTAFGALDGALDAGPLENVLIEQVIICWLRSQVAFALLFAHIQQGNQTQMNFFDKHADKANKAFLKACETLAKVQKLAKRDPVLQVNIANQQVNQVGG